ncbi:MAG TPA: hypothetical protein PKV73_15865 [Agriterribacter sp.]|nr:hypothetical protein [Chitinophagaceae bacterium]HRP33375.1 hypothetical protein [Agriterribacter sp.]
MLSGLCRITPIIHAAFLFVLIALADNNIFAQTKSEIAHSKEIHEGTWYNKNDRRYIRFNYNEDANFVTINDWIKGAKDNGDAYKAFIKGERLILYSEDNDHRAPYCEIEIANTNLIYRCNKMNSTDNFLHTKEPGNRLVFTRVKK